MKVSLRLGILTLLTITVFHSASAQAQNVTVDSQQPRLLLAATSADTLQQELNKAGALGFHATEAASRGNGEMVLLLERDLKAREKVQFLLVATTATGSFQKEISDAALAGYRVVPRTFLNKPTGLAGNEIVVVMERSINPAKRYEYKLLATNQTSHLESEWGVAASIGYRTVGLITRAEVMALMERESQ